MCHCFLKKRKKKKRVGPSEVALNKKVRCLFPYKYRLKWNFAPPKCPFKKNDKWTDGQKGLRIKVGTTGTSADYIILTIFNPNEKLY